MDTADRDREIVKGGLKWMNYPPKLIETQMID